MLEFSDKSTLTKFDVINFAKNILTEIEKIRAFDKLVDEESIDNFKVPTESRINAFFRLIGLPMFVSITGKQTNSGLRHISSGYSAKRINSNIQNAEEVNGQPITKQLVDRETSLQKMENSIGDAELNKRMALSLIIPIPLIPNIPDNNQIDGYIGYGENKRIVYKKLFPLIVQYRSILPKSNEIAAPFTTLEDRKINNTTELQIPFIETVIRIRLITAENAITITEKQNEDTYLSSLSNYLAEDDYNKIIKDFAALKTVNILETFILNKLFISLEQLANKWIEIKKKQHLAAKQDIFDISIKTTSSKRNPLGKRVDVSTNLTLRKEGSTVGNRLAWLRKREAEEEAFLSLLPTDDIINAGKTSNTSLSALINEFSELLGHNLTQIRKEIQREEERIKRNIQLVEQLRLEIDMMTGEFSGLSIPDIVAVIIGLFLIEKKDLISLLDKETITDMKKDNSLKNAIKNISITTENAYTAIQNLEKAVRGVFKVLNIYINAIENKENKIMRRGKRQKRKEETTEMSLSNRSSGL